MWWNPKGLNSDDTQTPLQGVKSSSGKKKKRVAKALQKVESKRVQVNLDELNCHCPKSEQHDSSSQTEIVVGKNYIKAAAMTLLGKRCWTQTSKNSHDGSHSDADSIALNRVLSIERNRTFEYKKEYKESKQKLLQKDLELEEAVIKIKEEIKDKRDAQRDLRLFKEAQKEQSKSYYLMKKEIDEFKSNANGYVKRSKYQKLTADHDELIKENDHNKKLIEAWKGQVGRLQMQCQGSDKQLEKLEQIKCKFTE